MSNQKLDWSAVLDNSSSTDAIVCFAQGHSLKYCLKLVHDSNVKSLLYQLNAMKSCGRTRARTWCARNGYDYSVDYDVRDLIDESLKRAERNLSINGVKYYLPR